MADTDMIILIIVVGALAIGLLSMLVGKVVDWWDRFVNSSQVVMSRAEQDATENTPLSLRQTEPQTDRPPLTREIMLDVYKLLREHNVSRERARPILKAAGIPLDNNLWTQAAPPPEPISVTPIAGRPTNAEFRDPELTYHPPPR